MQPAAKVQRSSSAARHPQINNAIINGLACPLLRLPIDSGKRSARPRMVGTLEDEDEYDWYLPNQQITAERYARPVAKRQTADAAQSGTNANGANNAAANGL